MKAYRPGGMNARTKQRNWRNSKSRRTIVAASY